MKVVSSEHSKEMNVKFFCCLERTMKRNIS